MPVLKPTVAAWTYHLVSFDANGEEREGRIGRVSEDVAVQLAEGAITDVIVLCHGWQGDVPAALDQYDRWVAAAAACDGDLAGIRRTNPRFLPLIVGLHWPSLPWGDEEMPAANTAFAPAAWAPEALLEAYAQRISGSPAARGALRTILESARRNMQPRVLSADVRDAYETLNREAALGGEGEGAAPGDDRDPFDPDRAYALSRQDAVAFGGGNFGGVLGMLRQLSFYKMKDRARRVGEGAAADLFRRWQLADTGGHARFHLMGHSFGCIVVSAMIAGGPRSLPLPRPVDSAMLVQGALSLWSYCSDIPKARGRPGYFQSVVSGHRVSGPIVTTQSTRDSAVGRFYPLAAGVARHVSFASGDYPKYGGLGSFGARGPDVPVKDGRMLPVSAAYDFRGGTLYNLESSDVIRQGTGISGAHSDIAGTEVAHTFWQAAYPRRDTP